jgi:hypothetical protein
MAKDKTIFLFKPQCSMQEKNSKLQGNGKEENTYLKLLLKLCVFHLIKESKHIEYI